ncbi:thioredoxin [Catovirus CTV1]|uniref:Thioredoxin n=1 Tax=Catovirus CTV1 TaxID=1977631 RepID=A0A1V0SCD6_9VIRU|nr:thioredoxin [Catovirus CTV1]
MEKSGINDFISKNMFLIIIIIVFIIAMLCIFFANSNQNNALIIKREPFNSDKQYKIILYYTTWCGYSIKILPEWEKFMEHIKKNNINNLIVEKIDCDKNKSETGHISGYPTIIFYDDEGNHITMNDPKYSRTKEGLSQFVNDNMK